ncbi:hypothetical protein PpBr36_02545 [Pyricularia pennisetigena]|uniref:hypothetical protein n=1 Tax=Pyricularia pennisetigena TaxID=1578925 RepID=UPI00114DCE92|nr:hypothetical protein PpBr36_02545 [Pyricularia pennisetigena]TLS29926.1 hypothetical protein PpBr36_02545 [Pyricularia pennisetigena]
MAAVQKLNVQTFPRPPALQKISRHVQIKWDGDLIADTKDAYWVLETHHPPTYYLPPSSVLAPLAKTTRRTYCEWKGHATYHVITHPTTGKTVENKVWSYEQPTEGFVAIKDYLSFYANAPWECYVDGEKVKPQPGDFYGGWVTSDIGGIVKGQNGNADPPVVAHEEVVDKVGADLVLLHRVRRVGVGTDPHKVDPAAALALLERGVGEFLSAALRRRRDVVHVLEVVHVGQGLGGVAAGHGVEVSGQRHGQLSALGLGHFLHLCDGDLDAGDAGLGRHVVEVRVGVQEASLGRDVLEHGQRHDAAAAGARRLAGLVGRLGEPLGRARHHLEVLCVVDDGTELALGLAVLARHANVVPSRAQALLDVVQLVAEHLLQPKHGGRAGGGRLGRDVGHGLDQHGAALTPGLLLLLTLAGVGVEPNVEGRDAQGKVLGLTGDQRPGIDDRAGGHKQSDELLIDKLLSRTPGQRAAAAAVALGRILLRIGLDLLDALGAASVLVVVVVVVVAVGGSGRGATARDSGGLVATGTVGRATNGTAGDDVRARGDVVAGRAAPDAEVDGLVSGLVDAGDLGAGAGHAGGRVASHLDLHAGDVELGLTVVGAVQTNVLAAEEVLAVGDGGGDDGVDVVLAPAAPGVGAEALGASLLADQALVDLVPVLSVVRLGVGDRRHVNLGRAGVQHAVGPEALPHGNLVAGLDLEDVLGTNGALVAGKVGDCRGDGSLGRLVELDGHEAVLVLADRSIVSADLLAVKLGLVEGVMGAGKRGHAEQDGGDGSGGLHLGGRWEKK